MGIKRNAHIIGTLFAFVIVMTGATAAQAGDSYWKLLPPATGDWFEPNNWTAGTPAAGDGAYINNGGVVEIKIHDAEAIALYVGFEGNSGGIVHTSGSLDVGQVFYLGYYSDSSGSYRLENTGELRFYNGIVGASGTGYFAQYGGTSRGAFLYVGYGSGSNGLYEFSDGDLRITNNVVVGQRGTGRFIQTGGVFQMGGYNWMGDRPGSIGIFELHGGELDSGTLLYIGASGTGKFIHTGGIHAAHILDIGWSWNEPAQGTYELSGAGQLSAFCIDLGSSTSTGTFIQTGGTNNLTKYLAIRNGSYTISGGGFTAKDLRVAVSGSGTFAVSGSQASIMLQTYAQGSNGNLISVIGSGGISTIEVAGPATLDGTWTVEKNGAAYGRFDILTAGEGISGIFDSVTLPSLNWTWGIENNHTLWTEYAPLEIAIDIKPASDPNSINLGAKGVVPVAIFGTEDFDVHDVDQFSLLLEGAGPREKGKDGLHVAFEYINDDLFLDLIVQFPLSELEPEPGATEATLTGTLLDGTEFAGMDAVRLVGGPVNPEPGTLSLLVLGGLAVIRRKRK